MKDYVKEEGEEEREQNYRRREQHVQGVWTS